MLNSASDKGHNICQKVTCEAKELLVNAINGISKMVESTHYNCLDSLFLFLPICHVKELRTSKEMYLAILKLACEYRCISGFCFTPPNIFQRHETIIGNLYVDMSSQAILKQASEV